MTEDEIRTAIARQSALDTIGVTVAEIGDGRVVLRFVHAAHLTQHHGFIHAGILTTVVDTACGFAAATRMPTGRDVLTIEFKVNFLRPAKADVYLATGHVVRSGRTITVCEGAVTDEASATEIARMQATMMAVDPPGDRLDG